MKPVVNVFAKRKLQANTTPRPAKVAKPAKVVRPALTPNSCDPVCLGDVMGQDPAKNSLLSWIRNGGRTLCVLSGPTGCGKSCMARMLFKETGRQVMDPRVCESNMETFLTDVMRTKGNNSKLGILIDDLETLAAPTRTRLLAILTKKNPTVPVICTVTDPKDKAVATFVKACGTSIRMEKPRCAAALIRKHAPTMKNEEVNSIERACGGDLRQAVVLTVQAMTWKRHHSVVSPTLTNRSDRTDPRVRDMFSATDMAFASKSLDDVVLCITHNSVVPIMVQEHLVKKSKDVDDLCQRLDDMSSGDLMDSHRSHTTHEHASHQYASACMGMRASNHRVSFPASLAALSRRNGNNTTFSEVRACYSTRFASHEDEDMVNTLIRCRMHAGQVPKMSKQTVKKFKDVKYLK